MDHGIWAYSPFSLVPLVERLKGEAFHKFSSVYLNHAYHFVILENLLFVS